MELWLSLLITLIKILVVLGVFLGVGAYLTWFERKLAGHIQARMGPKLVGPFGLLQPLADGIKLLTKESVIPQNADKPVYYLAVVMAVAPAILLFSVIPFGPEFTLFGYQIKPIIADVNIALLLVFAFGSLAVYGTIFSGWASNSKYAFLGSLRKASVIISYEVVLGFSVLGVILLAGTMSTTGIVQAQIERGVWFIVYQPVAFILYLFCMLAESGRVPFDIQEAEAELVTGYNVEYGGMRFGVFPLAEWYLNVMALSAIAVVLFFGGWSGPYIFGPLSPYLWFLIKMFALVFFVLWLHWTLPRFQAKDITEIGWKIMLPISIVNVVLTAVLAYIL
ncbi:NADH-quinone oxidoreductase subunit NuoH [Pampinifervens florentissimum]|uniref:NADH-quinone oxidoreductase subunit NuoH n=1 Tax=Pampinifervens florentissimum TaxID=1632019 RepID=UPI00156F48AB|nr:NADH-quinone oxidoreductase subunit NuoH [Hydrogenobacter sp. T-8]